MGRGETKFELLLLFDRLKIEPTKLMEFLNERDQKYSKWTIWKYYNHYRIANDIYNSIMNTKNKKR